MFFPNPRCGRTSRKKARPRGGANARLSGTPARFGFALGGVFVFSLTRDVGEPPVKSPSARRRKCSSERRSGAFWLCAWGCFCFFPNPRCGRTSRKNARPRGGANARLGGAPARFGFALGGVFVFFLTRDVGEPPVKSPPAPRRKCSSGRHSGAFWMGGICFLSLFYPNMENEISAGDFLTLQARAGARCACRRRG